MACRDCAWWKQKGRWKDRGHTFSDCVFPVPFWVPHDYDGQQADCTRDDEGEGCPQFKEREDGVS